MPAHTEALLRLEVPLIVQLAQRTMRLEEVMRMSPGTIIELPKSADDSLDILVASKRIGGGSAVKIGENFGVRVTSIGPPEQRINAMEGLRVQT